MPDGRKPLSFLLIDVDRFKEVNTRFEHLTGDFVLSEITALLRSSVRGSDAVVRYGGDEFLLPASDASRCVPTRALHHEREHTPPQRSPLSSSPDGLGCSRASLPKPIETLRKAPYSDDSGVAKLP